MSNVDGGDAELLLQRLDLVAHFEAHLGVQVREGVEVFGLEIDGGHLRSLRTSAGPQQVERLVLTAGAETSPR